MRVSIAVPGLPADVMAEVVRHADELGYEAVWLSDHTITPLQIGSAYPSQDGGKPYHPWTEFVDQFVMIGYLAGVTRRIKLATGIYILPIRQPLLAALAIRTATTLSKGRMLLGVGVGWMKEEYDLSGSSFETRGARFDEMLDIIALALAGEPFQYQGKHYDIPLIQQGGGRIEPPKLIFGGESGPALRRAARRGQGWLSTPKMPIPKLIEVRSALEEQRNKESETGSFPYYVRADSPSEEHLGRLKETGFEDVVIELPRDENQMYRPLDGPGEIDEAKDFMAMVLERAEKI